MPWDFLAARFELVAVLPEYTLVKTSFIVSGIRIIMIRQLRLFALFIENIF